MSSSQKFKTINKVIPQNLQPHLHEGLYMCVDDTFYKVTAKIVRGLDKKEYYLDFKSVNKDNLKDVIGKGGTESILKNFNYDYADPIPFNLRSEFEFVIDGVIWNSYNYPIWDEIDVKDEKSLEDLCPMTMKLHRQIYGEKYLKTALDYFTVEFMNPMQPLPIQVLFSPENETGKSTYINHRKWIYGNNAAVIDSGTFDDKFNGLVVAKNFVGIDEGKLKDEAAYEKIKTRVTSPTMPHRAMRKTAVEVTNFAKYFLTTNRYDFAKLDAHDRRFWVTKVEPMKDSDYVDGFDGKLIKEIPYFLGFTKVRWRERMNPKMKGLMRMDTPIKEKRLWFHHNKYKTNIFDKVVRSGRTFAAKTILDVFIEWFDRLNDFARGEPGYSDVVLDIYANIAQIKDGLFKNDFELKTTTIRNAMEREFGLSVVMSADGETPKNQSYLNYIECYDSYNKIYTKPKQIKRRNVYHIKYVDLVEMRDGGSINNYGEVTGVSQGEIDYK